MLDMDKNAVPYSIAETIFYVLELLFLLVCGIFCVSLFFCSFFLWPYTFYIIFFCLLFFYNVCGFGHLAYRRKQSGFWMQVASAPSLIMICIGLFYDLIYHKRALFDYDIDLFRLHTFLTVIQWGFIVTGIIALVLYAILRLGKTWKKLEPISRKSILINLAVLILSTLFSFYVIYYGFLFRDW